MPSSPPEPDQINPESSTSLCTNCGLCCTGALHDNAIINPDEIEAVRALGLTVTEGDRPSFSLGCACLVGTRCSVYERRPTPCQFYRCQLLIDFEAGKMPLEDAREKTRVARNLLDQLNAIRPAGLSLASLRAQARNMGKSPAAKSLLAPDLLMVQLQFTAFALYLDKHFMNHKNDRRHFKTSVIGQPEPGGKE